MKYTHFHYFESWDSWLAHADDNARAYKKDPDRFWHFSGFHPGRENFYGSTSFEGALDLARSGWADGTDQILRGLEEVPPPQGIPSAAPARAYDVAGEFPDVAAFCAGEMEHMVTPDISDMAVPPVIRLWANAATGRDISAGQRTGAAIVLVSYLDTLMAAGHSVELIWYHALRGRKRRSQYYATGVIVIRAGAPLDIDRVAFAFAHTSMLRRLQFAAKGRDQDWRGLGGALGEPIDAPPPAEWLQPGDAVLPWVRALCKAHTNAERQALIATALRPVLAAA